MRLSDEGVTDDEGAGWEGQGFAQVRMRREGHVSKPFIRRLLTWRHFELGEQTIDIPRLPEAVTAVWREVHP